MNLKYPIHPVVTLAACIACLCAMPQGSFAAEAAPTAEKKPKEGTPPTPATLVVDMRKAAALIAKGAKEKISIKSKEAAPFWSALKEANEAIGEIEAGVKAGDGTMLAGLDNLGMSIHQLAASWGVLRSSVKGGQSGSGIIALSKAYEVFLFNYGPSVARKHLGGEVTDAEKAQLTAARAEVESLKAQIAAVEAKLPAKTYQKRFTRDILALCDDLAEVKGNDLKSYCAYLFQYNRLMYTAVAYNTLIDVWYPETGKQLASAPSSKKRPVLAFEKSSGDYYKGWKYVSVPVEKYGDYYQVTACVSTVTTTEISTFESYTESYSEETAIEESSEETTAINEEVSMEEGEESSFADEVADGADDEDGDGTADEADTDDDNDGTGDEADTDDDGDGVMDTDEPEDDTADNDDAGEDDGDASMDEGDGGGEDAAEDSGDDAGDDSAEDSSDDGGDENE